MKIKFYLFFISAIFTFWATKVSATHVMGGSITYDYIGLPNPSVPNDPLNTTHRRYAVKITSYIDCETSTVGPDNVIQLGYYHESLNANGTPNTTGNKTLFVINNVPLFSQQTITPPVPPGCPIQFCVTEAVYIDSVNLPIMNGTQISAGYHVVYGRCCRNGAIIVNLNNPGAQGIVFYSYISPPLLQNSSPRFNDLPVPVICENLSTPYLNTATDPDGDLLIYSFVTPYNGYTSSANPTAAPPATLTWPINSVTYLNANFNANAPFGASGTAVIDGSTGISNYQSPTSGITQLSGYVICVEVKEFRQGNLIGVIRRDLQILSSPNCSANLKPVLNATANNLTVEVGQSVSITYTGTDPNVGQVLGMYKSGELFGTTISPNATLNLPAPGTTQSATLTWTPSCTQGRALPYTGTVSLYDNGCLPDNDVEAISITVNPFTGPTSISGNTNVCSGLSNVMYTTQTISGATYNWSVTGGTIVSGQGNDTILVNWSNSASLGVISVSATSQFGCSSTPIDLNINVAPTFVNAGVDDTVCVGQSLTLGGTPTAFPGFSIQWAPSATLSSSTALNPTATPLATTTYFVTATDAQGCAGVDSIKVTVSPSPTVNAGNDISICIGNTAQLSASGATTYSWTPAASLSNATISNPIASPSSTTNYIVTGIVNGCPDTDTVTVTVTPNLVVNAGTDKVICPGTTTTLGGNPTSSTGVNFTWTPATGLSSTTIANPIANPATAQQYIVSVTDANGCSGVDTVNVTIGTVPNATVTPNFQLLCAGTSFQLTASGGGVGGTYAWSPAAGLSSASIANPTASPTASTNYIVTVTNSTGCTDTAIAVVQVTNTPIDAGINDTICIGQTSQLSVTPSNLVSYTWSPTGTLSSSSISNPIATPTSTTKYFVTATDANGCVSTDSVTVVTLSLPTATAGTDKTICLNDTVRLGGTPTGPTGSTFIWSPATALSSATASNPLFTGSSVGTTAYIVSVTNAGGCSKTDTVNVTVSPAPSLTTSNDTAICIGASAQLTATGTGSFSWSPAGTLSASNISNPIATPTTTTKYFVTLTSGTNCTAVDSILVTVNPLPTINAGNDTTICAGNSVQLNATGGVSYTWTANSTLSATNIANPIATPTATTTYHVSGTNANGCVNTDSIVVTLVSNPVANAGLDTSICLGSGITIGGSPTGPTGSTFTWAPAASLSSGTVANPIASPLITTQYIVTVTIAAGCTDTDTVTVTVNPLPTLTVNNDTAICAGSSVQLNAVGTGSFNWTPATGLSATNISNPIATPTATTAYIVALTGANGCIKTDTVNITVNGIGTIGASNDTAICIGASANLTAFGGTSYNWAPSATLSSNNTATTVATPLSTTNYLVTITNAAGCSAVDSVLVTVHGLPFANAGNDTAICIGSSITLGGAPAGPASATFVWTPNTSLSFDSTANPTANPTATVTYQLLVIDTNSCERRDTVVVTVNLLPTVVGSNDTTFCEGSSATLTVSGAQAYSWSPATGLNTTTGSTVIASPTANASYVVVGTDANGCVNSDTIDLTILPLPISNLDSSIWVCPGGDASIVAQGGVSYAWSPATFLSSTTIANPVSQSPTASITYFVTITGANNCVTTDSVFIDVNPIVPTNAGPDRAICINDITTLGASPTSPPNTIYNWSPSLSLNFDTVANPNAFPTGTTIYNLVTQNDTCHGADVVTITVNPLPTITASADTAICFGDSAQLTASGASSYLWNNGVWLNDSTLSNPKASPDTTISFVVTGTDANGCSSTDTTIVFVNPLPAIQITADTTICKFDTLQLSATGGILFSWTPTTTLSNPNSSSPLAFPNQNTTYIVNVIDINGCENTDSTVVTLFQLPNIGAGNDTTICEGDTIQLLATGGINFLWSPTATLSDPTIANPLAFPIANTTYSVVVGDANTCSDTASILVKVNPKPTIDAGNTAEVCIGKSVVLNASGAVVSYEWFPKSNISNPFISSPAVAPIDTMYYYVTGTNSIGCKNTDSVLVIVNPLPFVNAGPDKTLCLGSTVQLGGSPTGPNGSNFYAWLPTHSLDDATISNPFSVADTTTDYIVAVVDSNLCLNRDTVTVTVFRIEMAGNDTTVCFNYPLQLNVNEVDGLAPFAYTWTPSNGLSNPLIKNPIARPTNAITYEVFVADANGCIDSASISIDILPAPIADFTFEVFPSCNDVYVEFENNSLDGNNYLWLFGADLGSSTKENPSFRYGYETDVYAKLIVTNTESSCADSSVIEKTISSFDDYFEIEVPEVFSPNGDNINDIFEINFANRLEECTDIRIFNRWGVEVFLSEGYNRTWDGRTFDGEMLPAGVYFYTITVKGKSKNGTVTLLR